MHDFLAVEFRGAPYSVALNWVRVRRIVAGSSAPVPKGRGQRER